MPRENNTRVYAEIDGKKMSGMYVGPYNNSSSQSIVDVRHTKHIVNNELITDLPILSEADFNQKLLNNNNNTVNINQPKIIKEEVIEKDKELTLNLDDLMLHLETLSNFYSKIQNVSKAILALKKYVSDFKDKNIEVHETEKVKVTLYKYLNEAYILNKEDNTTSKIPINILESLISDKK